MQIRGLIKPGEKNLDSKIKDFTVGCSVVSVVMIGGCSVLAYLVAKARKKSKNKVNWHAKGSRIASVANLEKIKEANEIAFEDEYDGRYVYVLGTVDRVSKDSVTIKNNTYKYNKTFNMWSWQDDTMLCEVSDSYKKNIANIRKGDSLVTAGRLEYKSGGMFDSFSLEFCKFKINQTGRVTLEQAQQMFGAAPKAANPSSNSNSSQRQNTYNSKDLPTLEQLVIDGKL